MLTELPAFLTTAKWCHLPSTISVAPEVFALLLPSKKAILLFKTASVKSFATPATSAHINGEPLYAAFPVKEAVEVFIYPSRVKLAVVLLFMTT